MTRYHRSVAPDIAGEVLRRHDIPAEWGDPSDAAAWYGPGGDIRRLVAYYPNGMRAYMRDSRRKGCEVRMVRP
jgi:hypothetical protein